MRYSHVFIILVITNMVQSFSFSHSSYYFRAPSSNSFHCIKRPQIMSPSSPQHIYGNTICMKYRICELTGAKPNRKANRISFSDSKTRIIKGVNLQRKRLWWAERNKFISMRISCKVQQIYIVTHFYSCFLLLSSHHNLFFLVYVPTLLLSI